MLCVRPREGTVCGAKLGNWIELISEATDFGIHVNPMAREPSEIDPALSDRLQPHSCAQEDDLFS